MKVQIINLDIYRRSVVILSDCCIGEVEKWLAEHDNADFIPTLNSVDWDSTKAETMTDSLDIYVISLEPLNLPSLSHELSHAALKVLKIVGIDPIVAEEAYAYLFEYLITQVTSSDGVLSLSLQDASLHTAQSQNGQS